MVDVELRRVETRGEQNSKERDLKESMGARRGQRDADSSDVRGEHGYLYGPARGPWQSKKLRKELLRAQKQGKAVYGTAKRPAGWEQAR